METVTPRRAKPQTAVSVTVSLASGSAMAETCVDVECPAGSSEGDAIQVFFGETSYEVTVPQGIFEGMSFQMMLPAADAPPPEIDDVVTALNVVLDALEDHDDDVLDNLVDGRCAEFSEWEKGGEMKLEWHDLFTRYVREVEGFIGEVLASINTSAEAVVEQAQKYSGDDQRVKRLITRLLATEDLYAASLMGRLNARHMQIVHAHHSPTVSVFDSRPTSEVFCKMMRDRYEILQIFNS